MKFSWAQKENQMNLLDKSLWQPTLFRHKFMAECAKDHMKEHFDWACSIEHLPEQEAYSIVFPDNLIPEEYCLGQSFLLGFAHGFEDRATPSFKA